MSAIDIALGALALIVLPGTLVIALWLIACLVVGSR